MLTQLEQFEGSFRVFAHGGASQIKELDVRRREFERVVPT